MPMGPGYSTTMGGGGVGIDPITGQLVGQLGGALIGALFGGNKQTTNTTQMQQSQNKGVNPQFQQMMGGYKPDDSPPDYLAKLLSNNQNYWG